MQNAGCERTKLFAKLDACVETVANTVWTRIGEDRSAPECTGTKLGPPLHPAGDGTRGELVGNMARKIVHVPSNEIRRNAKGAQPRHGFIGNRGAEVGRCEPGNPLHRMCGLPIE